MARKALIDPAGVVRNIIEYDPEGNYVPPRGFSLQDAGSAQVGWRFDGSSLTGPPTLMTDRGEVASDGIDAATVTYVNHWPGAPGQVSFVVNGTTGPSVMLVDGAAAIEVTSSTPGDTITVETMGLTTTIEVA